MIIKKSQKIILAINLIIILFFTIFYSVRKNYEFLMYIGTIIFFLIILILTNEKIKYSDKTLWGLTFWSLLHMSGGSVMINGSKLYGLILINISEKYGIFRFDQFVHIVGFCVATLVMYELAKHILQEKIKNPVIFSIIIVMAGLGVGALNEIVEFIATVLIPETGVGGYINTSLDLVSDLIGSLIALLIIFKTKK